MLLEVCAETMCDALDYAPCLGIVGGGEIGQHGDASGTCSAGSNMCSAEEMDISIRSNHFGIAGSLPLSKLHCTFFCSGTADDCNPY